tara:strand:- start:27795 stop:29135 length:1341 start_codon:yes stop_codon:yes gene_type:complete
MSHNADRILMLFMEKLAGIEDKALLSKLEPNKPRHAHIKKILNMLSLAASKSAKANKDELKKFRRDWFSTLQEDVEQRYASFEAMLNVALPEWQNSAISLIDKVCSRMSVDDARGILIALDISQPIDKKHPLHTQLKRRLTVRKLRWIVGGNATQINQHTYDCALNRCQEADNHLCEKLMAAISSLDESSFFTLCESPQSLPLPPVFLQQSLSIYLSQKEGFPPPPIVEYLFERFSDRFEPILENLHERVLVYFYEEKKRRTEKLVSSGSKYAASLNIEKVLALVGEHRQANVGLVYEDWRMQVANPLMTSEEWSWCDKAELARVANIIKSKARNLLSQYYGALDKDLSDKIKRQREARKAMLERYPHKPSKEGWSWRDVRVMHVEHDLEEGQLLQKITTSNNDTLYIFWPKGSVGLRQFEIIDCHVNPGKDGHLWIQKESVTRKQ